MPRSILLYEFNEVPLRVVEAYARAHPASALAHLLERAEVRETHTEDVGHLSPWITWPSLHRGVTNREHHISDLGQDLADANTRYPSLMTLLARAGVRVGVFGSLHTWPPPPDVERYAFYVPDTFAVGSECYPSGLEAFQAFNLAMVDGSGRNVAREVAWRPALRFLWAAPRLGLRLATVRSLVRQLLQERRNPARLGRRRSSQAEIAFDIFFHQLAVTRPRLATFFTNHVASSMHRYWPAAFPEDYTRTDLGDGWRRTYADEIDVAMGVADRQLERLMRFVEKHPEHTLLVASSMGQAAVDGARIVTSQLYATDLAALMRALGAPEGQWERHRNMLPEYTVKVAEGALPAVRAALSTLAIQGRPVRWQELDAGHINLVLGHENLQDADVQVELHGKPASLQALGLRNTPIQDMSGSYAYHIPEGILLTYDPAHPSQTRGERVSTLRIAPTILARLGVVPPDYMQPALPPRQG